VETAGREAPADFWPGAEAEAALAEEAA